MINNFGGLGYKTVESYAKGRVLFRVDAGYVYGISTGHMFRCFSIAEYLKERGFSVSILARNYSLAAMLLECSGYFYRLFPIESNDAEHIENIEYDTLIVDYPNAHSIFSSLPDGKTLIWIDDIGLQDGSCVNPSIDAVINPSIVKKNHNYKISCETAVYAGVEYFFPNKHLREVKLKREKIKKFTEITIFMGGTDPLSLSEFVLPLVLKLGKQVNLIVGKGNKKKEMFASMNREHLKVFIGPDNIAELFLHTDVAVVSGGLVSYEALYLGIPSVILPTTDVEEENRSAFYAIIEKMRETESKKIWSKLRDVFSREILYTRIKNENYWLE